MNRKFRIALLCILIVIPSFILAEQRVIVHAGYNLSQHYGTKDQAAGYQVDTKLRHGFSAGLGLDLPINDRFSMAYEFNYVTRGSKENITISKIDGELLPQPYQMNVKYYMDYAEFPVLFKYNITKNNRFTLRAVSGVAMALKVSGDYTLDGKIYFPEQGGYTTIDISDQSNLDEVNMFDFSLIYGGELETTIKGLPVIAAYRFTIGWDYLALPTYEAGGYEPVNLRNQSYSFTLGVPFNLRLFN
jgi:hypothetical protein